MTYLIITSAVLVPWLMTAMLLYFARSVSGEPEVRGASRALAPLGVGVLAITLYANVADESRDFKKGLLVSVVIISLVLLVTYAVIVARARLKARL